MTSSSHPTSLEAKIVVLGSQAVGKTSLVHRFCKNAFIPPSKAQSTVGASFLTARVNDPESGTTIRLQIWDTAGQERFRSISRLYYRGANAAILAYDVTSRESFEDMSIWLKELRENCGPDIVIHVVGTKTDVLNTEPHRREVPFERCIGYVAEQLHPEIVTPGLRVTFHASMSGSHGIALPPLDSPTSNRSSGFWGAEAVFDFCHEVSAKEGEGIDEVFRVITRKLVEQHNRKMEHQRIVEDVQARIGSGSSDGYFDLPNGGNGSFRLGGKRRSWLGIPKTPGDMTTSVDDDADVQVTKGMNRGRCC